MKLSRLILCLSICIISALNIFAEVPGYRKIILTKGDSILHFNICSSTKEIKCKNDVLYHWYQNNDIHKNRGNYSGHLIHGELKTYDNSGNMVEFGEIKYGVKKGKWIQWHKNGEIKQETKWSGGMKNGTERHYDDQGKIVMKRRYRNDKIFGSNKVYSDGKKIKIPQVKSGKKEKGEKKLKVEKFNKSGKSKEKEKKKDKENREQYQWFKDFFKKKENIDRVS